MIDRQFARYVVVGAFNTGASYLVYAFFIWLGLAFQWANLCALAVGTLISFATQSRFVFANRNWRRIAPYTLVWGLMYCLNIGLIWIFKQSGLNDYVAGLAALPVVVGTSYLLQKSFVFVPRTNP
ncbi:MAG: GtrA family protein [Steroidobacteraceae bacterium]